MHAIETTTSSDASGWKFPFLNDGTREGFNVSAIDMFKSERLQAMVREMIQNSLDARENKHRPVEVRFTLNKITDLEGSGFKELKKYFSAAQKLESTVAGKAFYKQAIAQVDDGEVKVLGVHDYNTKGLTGPTYDPPQTPQSGPWLALVKGAGMTFKDSDAALGSFGHGSRAPFAMSELRTLFYFSRIVQGSGVQSRFQGKSILQSVPLSEITGENEWSVATGYFGVKDKCQPLLNNAVPGWATRARPESDADTLTVGTSIFIPEPYGVDDAQLFWAQVKLAVVANFYYAVLTDKLIVHLNEDERIDSKSVSQAFDDVTESDVLKDLDPTEKVLERLESSKTVRHHDLKGALELEGLGEVAWYLRLDDADSRRVGIARGNGMLITRTAEKLQRFHGLKPFDLFVCVKGDQGSTLLRKLENPEHTEFSFDRIGDSAEKKKAENAYGGFAKQIRNLLKEHASIEIQEELEVDDLDDFFRGDLGSGADDEKGEPSRTLRIVKKIIKPHRESTPSEVSGQETDIPGRGTSGGDSPRKTTGGSIPGAGAGRAKGGLKWGIPVRNLRIVRKFFDSGVADVSFTPVHGSGKTLILLRSGETETEPLQFRTETEVAQNLPWRDSIDFADLSSTARKRVRLVFRPKDLDYAIEGRLKQ